MGTNKMNEARGTLTSTKNIGLVMLGSDTGIYALGRDFHQCYGIRPKIVARAAFGPIKDSKILDVHEIGLDVTRRDYIDYLIEHAEELRAGNEKTILLCNTDHLVEALCEAKDELESLYELVIPPLKTYERISDKVGFAELCEQLEIPTPKTIGVQFGAEENPQLNALEAGLEFPVIAKPALSADYENVKFEGQKKVFQLADQTEVDQLIQTLQQAGFQGQFVFQQKINGDDTTMRSLTAYVNRRGEVTLMSGARVLLEDHAPGLIGVPLAMVTQEMPELMAQAKKLLESVDYYGFANFDIKVDSVSDKPYFLEVNPRIGRNAYYTVAGGSHPSLAVMEDIFEVADPRFQGVEQEALYSLVDAFLLSRYIDEEDRRMISSLPKDRIVHPLNYSADRGVKRMFYVYGSTFKQRLKFKKYYPVRNAEVI
ncbi:carboxylate--amine ligase [Boudabousia liubingyangii]|uniref:carboxylate--amine ligase n=1 Tax=Boudabousia liubingyangii TaxID=1921764 RepID=UPI0009FA2A4B|nr:ATP-grasp domain-containing protein [Boudabousia liubingyangii]